jgi:hypothetical protein
MRWPNPDMPPESDHLVVWLHERQPPQDRDTSEVPDVALDTPVEAVPLVEPQTTVDETPISDEPSVADPDLPLPVDEEEEAKPGASPRSVTRSIDWEAAKRTTIIHMRDEIARSDTYLNFSHPEQAAAKTLYGETDTVSIAGVDIPPRAAPCVGSVGWLLARVLLPSDLCEWRRTSLESPLSAEERGQLVLPALPEGDSDVDRSIYGRR